MVSAFTLPQGFGNTAEAWPCHGPVIPCLWQAPHCKLGHHFWQCKSFQKLLQNFFGFTAFAVPPEPGFGLRLKGTDPTWKILENLEKSKHFF